MTENLPWEFEGRADRLFIHFDVKDHFLKLDTFIQTAENARKVIEAINKTFFHGSLKYELIVLPPEDGTFLSKLGFYLASPVAAVFAFLCTDPGAAFTKGLTGETPSWWFEQAGYEAREGFEWIGEQLTADEANSFKPIADNDHKAVDEESACKAAAQIVIAMTRGMLEKDTDELVKIGMDVGNLPDALDARAEFYSACINNHDVQRIGFTPDNDFPIPRNSFPERAQKPVRKEIEEEPPGWTVSIESIYVTSPNWDEADQKTRQWKGKDQNRRDCYFMIEDAEFWNLVKKKALHVEVLDNLKVQWAYECNDGGPKNRRVLRVLEFNGDQLSEPLTDDAIKAILGNYSTHEISRSQGSLFDEKD